MPASERATSDQLQVTCLLCARRSQSNYSTPHPVFSLTRELLREQIERLDDAGDLVVGVAKVGPSSRPERSAPAPRPQAFFVPPPSARSGGTFSPSTPSKYRRSKFPTPASFRQSKSLVSWNSCSHCCCCCKSLVCWSSCFHCCCCSFLHGETKTVIYTRRVIMHGERSTRRDSPRPQRAKQNAAWQSTPPGLVLERAKRLYFVRLFWNESHAARKTGRGTTLLSTTVFLRFGYGALHSTPSAVGREYSPHCCRYHHVVPRCSPRPRLKPTSAPTQTHR